MGHIGIMENNIETTIGVVYRGILYRVYIGIMEKNMETI